MRERRKRAPLRSPNGHARMALPPPPPFPYPPVSPCRHLMIEHSQVGKPQEEGGDVDSSKNFPQYETKVIEPIGDKDGTKVEVETCTTQPNYFAPTRQ